MGTGFFFTIDNVAIAGGIGGGSPDPLDPMTAYLYTQFRMGTLGGFNSAVVADVDGLQNAIWYIENEITVLPTGLATTYYNEAVLANWTDLGQVAVRNLYTYNTDGKIVNKQSVVTMVPEPMTLLLLGFGLLGLGITRRKLKK
jgi:hypothetical protein